MAADWCCFEGWQEFWGGGGGEHTWLEREGGGSFCVAGCLRGGEQGWGIGLSLEKGVGKVTETTKLVNCEWK